MTPRNEKGSYSLGPLRLLLVDNLGMGGTLRCGAGLGATHQYNPVLPYAQRLKNALNSRGYVSVSVTGYLGDVRIGHSEYFAPWETYAHPDTATGTWLGVKVGKEPDAQSAKNQFVKV